MKKELSPKQLGELLAVLRARLEARREKLWSLAEMERTGGDTGFIERWTKELGLINHWRECNP